MSLRISGCLLAVLFLGLEVNAQVELQDALLAQETKLIDAINRKDKATIAALLSDESLSITPARGRQTTDDVIADLENVSFADYRISDVRTISVSQDVAILTYKSAWTNTVAGHPPVKAIVYATAVWNRRDGQWRSVFYQETPLAEQ